MNEASAQRDELLGILRSYEGLDLTPRSLVTIEGIYADLVRRRAFRTTMFHSRNRFERAMGFYFGAVLVEMKRARWSDAADGVAVERVDGSGALQSLEPLCRDWFKRRPDEQRDSLFRFPGRLRGRTPYACLPAERSLLALRERRPHAREGALLPSDHP